MKIDLRVGVGFGFHDFAPATICQRFDCTEAIVVGTIWFVCDRHLTLRCRRCRIDFFRRRRLQCILYVFLFAWLARVDETI